MKLELKHIAPYLPYDLMCKCMGESINFEVIGTLGHDYINVSMVNSPISDEVDFSDVFPMLRPLEDINKLIKWQDGEYMMTDIHYSEFDLEEQSYNSIESYLKRHFDIFNLIPNGLAIPIQ